MLTLGLIYLAVGILSLYLYRNIYQTLSYYGVSEEIMMSVPDIAQTRGQLWGAFVAFSIISVIVLFVGLGLCLAKEWARKSWLVLVSLLLLIHVARLILDYQTSNLLLLERVLEVLLMGALATLSWRWLWRRPINQPAAT